MFPSHMCNTFAVATLIQGLLESPCHDNAGPGLYETALDTHNNIRKAVCFRGPPGFAWADHFWFFVLIQGRV